MLNIALLTAASSDAPTKRGVVSAQMPVKAGLTGVAAEGVEGVLDQAGIERAGDAEGDPDQHVAPDQRIAERPGEHAAPRDQAGRPVAPDPRLDAEVGEPGDAGAEQLVGAGVEELVLLTVP